MKLIQPTFNDAAIGNNFLSSTMPKAGGQSTGMIKKKDAADFNGPY